MENKAINREIATKQFEDNQTETGLQGLKNHGMELRHLVNNKWERLTEFKLPFRFIRLYDNNLNLFAIGVY